MSIRDLDFNNTGAWPREFKIGFCALLALFIIRFSWWFVTDKRDELAGLDGQKANAGIPSRAAPPTSSPLKQQLAQMEQQLQQMLSRQLPSKTEMPDLIVDISQTAL